VIAKAREVVSTHLPGDVAWEAKGVPSRGGRIGLVSFFVKK
jgi:hypothetical protein